MTIQPSPADQLPEPRDMLFTPGPRLGWTYTDPRSRIARYSEPPPDLDSLKEQAAQRVGAAQRSWDRARKWGLRPSLVVLIVLVALGGCAHILNSNAPFGTTVLSGIILALPGTGWALWRFAQLNLAKDVDPQRQYETAYEAWRQRPPRTSTPGSPQLAGVPEWGSAVAPVPADRRLRRDADRVAVPAHRARRVRPRRTAAAGRRPHRPGRRRGPGRARPPRGCPDRRVSCCRGT